VQHHVRMIAFSSSRCHGRDWLMAYKYKDR
jgi:hypothetical protein